MKYSKELHDRLRNRTGLHGFNHFVGVDSGDIDALLDEIERLNSHIVVMEDTIAELRIAAAGTERFAELADAWKRYDEDGDETPFYYELIEPKEEEEAKDE